MNLLAFLAEGARSLLFMRPRWHRLAPSPARMACLLALGVLLGIGFQRLYIVGPADFKWAAATAGWTGTLLLAWACYLLRPATPDQAGPPSGPSSTQLFTLLLGQTCVLMCVIAPLFAVLLRSGALDKVPVWVHWTIWLTPLTWINLAEIVVLLRARGGALRTMGAVLTILFAAALNGFLARPPAFWNAAGTETTAGANAEEDETPYYQPTQEDMEAQAPMLAEQAAALKPQRPGVVDMYTITFAPYEGEEVFRRESRMVADVMARRFDAAGRGLQLINHLETVEELPWATPLNLQRAISAVAGVMDRNEDVLFIHLTSHGAADGELAANFWPLDIAPVMPDHLRKWLDDAGIKYRVLSISACYAGNWIKPLSAEGTLVMTASDADHTSYGCGRKSPLTFFGRAMYDEQLRTTTLSFEEAHAASRKIILQREKEAGKEDGYSNPQIKVGSAIVPVLQRQREQLEQPKAR